MRAEEKRHTEVSKSDREDEEETEREREVLWFVERGL